MPEDHSTVDAGVSNGGDIGQGVVPDHAVIAAMRAGGADVARLPAHMPART